VKPTEGPLPITALHPFNKDGRTRISLFALNIDSEYGGGYLDIEVIAEDDRGRSYPLEAEGRLTIRYIYRFDATEC
jgi:hypothetical protein